MSVVLMYHALYRGDDTSQIDAEDLPYAVSEQHFVAQLDELAKRRVGLLDSTTAIAPEVIITFDDGHISNYDIAMPLLAERGLTAYMFITANYVGKRAHFCHPEHLAHMASSGIEIGSHGTTHRFFNDLSASEAEAELKESAQQLSEHCAKPIRSISYPGGRYTQETLSLARREGYAQQFGSGFGTVVQSDLNSQSALNRVAIRRTTSLEEFRKIVNADPSYYAIQKSKQQGKLFVKKLLGNRLYHGLYKSISAR